ncbi:MAG TPA: APC family permease [Anaerolineae bacterium]
MGLERDKQSAEPERQNGFSSGDEIDAEPGVFNPELTTQEFLRGQHAGDQYVRVERPYGHLFRRVSPGTLRATEQVLRPRTTQLRVWSLIKHAVIGYPLSTEREIHERLTKVKALAVFASDALSSCAYATEEVLLVLVAGGLGAFGYSPVISSVIAGLLLIVAISYRQTIHAYPMGGGSYIVTRENIGEWAGLTAASALMLDYVLTVAVSISAGTAAILSAFPELKGVRACTGAFCLEPTVWLSLFFIAFVTVANLRGIRESGSIFMVPTYVFVGGLFVLIGIGVARWMLGLGPAEAVSAGPIQATEGINAWLLLTAFSAGSVAMSGTEAVADGVAAFKPPESRNAARTLTVMAVLLGIFFLGISGLAWHFGIGPRAGETILSQLGRAAFGTNAMYFIFQIATMGILVIAANTAFADFPRLSNFLARDDYMPHQFQLRGDRLAFSTGIVALGLIASVLTVLFQGQTHLLIPLYAVGVFLSFTLSQAGMVMRWYRTRASGWQRNMLVNGFGAVLTGVVLIINAVTKFEHGAFLIVLAVPLMVYTFIRINRHYRSVDKALALATAPALPHSFNLITLVVIPSLNYATERALTFARSISHNITAVNVSYDHAQAERLRQELKERDPDVGLVVLESPYRTFFQPLMRYVEALGEREPNAMITIILPEFSVRHFWERWLHNRAAARMSDLFRHYPNVTIVNVPYMIGETKHE